MHIDGMPNPHGQDLLWQLAPTVAKTGATAVIWGFVGTIFVQYQFKNLFSLKNVGAVLNQEIKDFLKTFTLPEHIDELLKQLNEGWDVLIKNLEFAAKFKELMAELEIIRENLQDFLSNIARDSTLKVVPWVALATGMIVGTPFLVSYVYRKAIYNIGKPKLATEVRYVGFYDRSMESLSNVISGLWESSLAGIKIGTGAAVIGAGAFVGSNAISLLKTGQVLSTQQTDEFANFILKGCLGIAATAAAGNAAILLYKNFKGNHRRLDKPVFHKDLNDTLEQIIQSAYNLQKNNGIFQNVLLYGPGGTGKTMISKFIAKNSDMNYVMMSGADLAQYITRGEHVTELNKLFEAAKRSSTPTILFIDEAESLCRNRDNIVKPELIELQNAFLNHTGEASNKIMLIMATNRIEDLDPAVLSRMDHKLFIGPPKINERKQIIQNYLPNFFPQKEIKELFPEEIVGSVALKTEGLTGRMIFKLLNAIRSAKNATAENKLTKEIISTGVRKFLEQEVRASEALHLKAKAPAALPAAPLVAASAA